MADFEITGLQLPTLASGVEIALRLLERLAKESRAFCLEAHLDSLEAMKQLATVVPSDRFACYCWREFRDPFELERPEFQRVSQARVIFEGAELLLIPRTPSDPYDWDGRPLESAVIGLELRHRPPLRSQDWEPSPEVRIRLADIAEHALGRALDEPVWTTSSYRERLPAHRYGLAAPSRQAALVAGHICVAFGLTEGLGSYEFLGRPDELETLYHSSHYHFEGFPVDCWNLNAQFCTPFALASQGYRNSELNIDAHRLPKAAEVIDRLGGRIVHCAVIRGYLAWRLGASEWSPHTSGNYLFISRKKGGYALYVGFEQYADGDPPVKRFVMAARPVVEQLGASMRRVSTRGG